MIDVALAYTRQIEERDSRIKEKQLHEGSEPR